MEPPETGSAAPGKIGGYRPFLLAGQKDWLAQRMAEKPDLTVQAFLNELQAKGTVVSFGTLWRFLGGLGLTFKKTFCQVSKTDLTLPDGVTGGRLNQGRIDPSRLVFIDETWIKTNMARLRGWSRCGLLLKAHAAPLALENPDFPRSAAL